MNKRNFLLPFTPRYVAFTASLVGAVVFAFAAGRFGQPALYGLALLCLGLVLLGLRDVVQTDHSILRNYPISAHLRFLFENVRPELRQYFFEDDKDGRPFSRDKRSIVYQRAKMNVDKRPFGTGFDVYAEGFEWLRHSLMPRPVSDAPFRIDHRRPALRPSLFEPPFSTFRR